MTDLLLHRPLDPLYPIHRQQRIMRKLYAAGEPADWRGGLRAYCKRVQPCNALVPIAHYVTPVRALGGLRFTVAGFADSAPTPDAARWEWEFLNT